MVALYIEPSKVQGELRVPPSKSHTLRAILFAALAEGISRIEEFLVSPDTMAMIEAVRLLGATVGIGLDALEIRGVNGNLGVAEDVIQCGNSGQVLRFVGALAALSSHYTILTGDHSIRHQRSIAPLLDAMRQLGAFAESSRGDGFAPVVIRGPFLKGKARLEGGDSQPVSGLLMAAACAPHPIEIEVIDPGEKAWVNLTLDWFKRLGIPFWMKDHRLYRMEGKARIAGFRYRVAGDFSTAAFPIAAALVSGSELTLHNLDMEDIQGDKKVISILQAMGAPIRIDAEKKRIKIEKGASLQGIQIDVNDCIDALPILSVLGCFAQGKTEIVNGAISRKKESDRIGAIAQELRKMGAQVEEKPDGLVIYSSTLRGAQVHAHRDHRIALSLSVAALGASSGTVLEGAEWIDKSYPGFCRDFQKSGAILTYGV